MFRRLLIANRGEIACRIIQTAQRLGIQTVAIYSSADRQSLHVAKADEAYWVGDAPCGQSYLNIKAIIEIAKTHEIDAIHPGYGFLSENADFASACLEAGIVFVGPAVAALHLMASKQLAKQHLEHAGVPLTPGYHGCDQTDDHLLQEATKIGFPVLLKAAHGGGGKGMRRVAAAQDFLTELAGARREAQASFGNDLMIIEKLIINPRHIEIQIMADNFGEVVHLFERDCSVQRRHQKIIEEAPAIGLSQDMRAQLTKAAKDVARSIDYRGAGTVEFLVQDEACYFMEMNTRLQVEHPVTEMITKLDLVEWQLRIAHNEPLPLIQEDIAYQGHAIECRICAEDPACQFMPATGQITRLYEPQGRHIRLDTGIGLNSTITQYYDPMMAKLIVWGETREQARRYLLQALKDFVMIGVAHNLAFLQTIITHPCFIKAAVGTDFLSQITFEEQRLDWLVSLMLVSAYDYLAIRAALHEPLHQSGCGWQLNLPACWSNDYQIEDAIAEVTIKPINGHEFSFTWQAQTWQLGTWMHQDRLVIDDGQQQFNAVIENHEDHYSLHLKNYSQKVYKVVDSGNVLHEATPSLIAPMPATVVAIYSSIGAPVKKGEAIMALEAMKMEHIISAPQDGVVSEIFFDIGAQVPEGTILLTLT